MILKKMYLLTNGRISYLCYRDEKFTENKILQIIFLCASALNEQILCSSEDPLKF